MRSSLGLPLLLAEKPEGAPVGVLEVVTTRTDVQWAQAIKLLAEALAARRAPPSGLTGVLFRPLVPASSSRLCHFHPAFLNLKWSNFE